VRYDKGKGTVDEGVDSDDEGSDSDSDSEEEEEISDKQFAYPLKKTHMKSHELDLLQNFSSSSELLDPNQGLKFTHWMDAQVSRRSRLLGAYAYVLMSFPD
jgi:hypothetical protein